MRALCYTKKGEIMRKFEAICGAEKLLNAYMSNDLSQIRNEFNTCLGNRKAFEKLCNDIDILHHYNYVNPNAFDAAVQIEDAKQRIFQKLDQYQRGKDSATKRTTLEQPHRSTPNKLSQGSEKVTPQYRFGFGKKEPKAIVTTSSDSPTPKEDKHRSFTESLNAGISLEQQKANVEAWSARQKSSSSSSSEDPYKEEHELSFP